MPNVSEEDIERERLKLERLLYLQQQQQRSGSRGGFPARRPYPMGNPFAGGAATGGHRPQEDWQPIGDYPADHPAAGIDANGRGGRRRQRNRQQQFEEERHEYSVERHIGHSAGTFIPGDFTITIRNDRCRGEAAADAGGGRRGGGGGGGRRRKPRRGRRGGGGGGDAGDEQQPQSSEDHREEDGGASPAVPEDGGFIDDDLDGVGAGVATGSGSWEQQLVADEQQRGAVSKSDVADGAVGEGGTPAES